MGEKEHGKNCHIHELIYSPKPVRFKKKRIEGMG
jgi:hypothetical protein